MPEPAGERHGTVKDPHESPINVLGLVMSALAPSHCSCCHHEHLFFVLPMEYSGKDDIVKKFLLLVDSFGGLKR